MLKHHVMDSKRLKNILEAIREVKIAVVGDYCMDAYWFMDESGSEKSKETGETTRAVQDQRYSLGGAGNVANNLVALGVKNISAFGVIGPDPFGIEMQNLLSLSGVNTKNLLVQKRYWSTHVYTKPYLGDVELGRIDFGNFNKLQKNIADELIERLSDEIPETDIVIINQQVVSGIHNDYFKDKLLTLISKFDKTRFIVDSRDFNSFYEGAYRKMNDKEAAKLCGLYKEPYKRLSFDEACKAASDLFESFQKPLFLTRAERGSIVVYQNGLTAIPGLLMLTKTDSVGAGDSYLAGTAAAMASGFEVVDAAKLGCYVAGVTVQKRFQTGTASPEEVMKLFTNHDFIYQPELAEDISLAKYGDKSDIEITDGLVDDLNIKYAIFDHDGTLSTLRQGWEGIMATMMTKTILGKRSAWVSSEEKTEVHNRVLDYINTTTGIQTLTQMKGLAGLVREFDYVPEEEILDEFAYKEIFNQDLVEMVRKRIKGLVSGDIAVEQYLLKNSVLLLEKLQNAGIKLFLVSGIDDTELKKDAKMLGYDHFFEDRIFGSVGDINKDAKTLVLDKILSETGTSRANSILTFGDGPVEIRETRKRGGISVGVACDEQKRYGLNPSKRKRLIQSGANIIVPDYLQIDHLLKLLNIN